MRAGGFVVLALGGLLLRWAPCSAESQDAGTRSPFADGPGCRALSLGGAFAAIADDGSALSWNPAGLSLVTRGRFEAVHTGRSELEAGDDYVVAVLPSWRWGAMAAGVRHMGVGGIDARDGRNVSGESFGATETEVAFGYARPWGTATRLGATVKMQRQSVGDFSASALGADVGALLNPASLFENAPEWLERWTMGLAVRNLIEPSLRLDRESVSDPQVWRAGLAWRGSLFGAALLSALDLDRSRGVGANLHAGAELRLSPWFALRGGLNAGELTAGASFAWRSLDVSYAFADAELGGEHRVGLSHAFGATVDEARAAARDRDEQALQGRLDEEFQRRRAEQLNGLLAEAESERARGSYESALELLGAAGTLDSTDRRVGALEARTAAQLGLALERRGDLAGADLAFARALAVAPADSVSIAGRERVRQIGERRSARDSERRRRFQAGLDAFAAGDLSLARVHFRVLAAADSAGREARDMLARVDQAVARECADLIGQARRRLEERSFEDAGRLLARARALDPAASGLQELEATWRSESRALKPLEGPKASLPTPAARKEAEQMYRRGVAAISARRPDDAMRFWEVAISLDPSHGGAQRSLAREYLVRGMDAYAAGRIDQAVDYWERARRANPSDPRAGQFLTRAHERLERSRQISGEGR